MERAKPRTQMGLGSASAKPPKARMQNLQDSVEGTPTEPHAQGEDPDREHGGVVRGRAVTKMQERIVVVKTQHFVVIQVPVLVPMICQPWVHGGHHYSKENVGQGLTSTKYTAPAPKADALINKPGLAQFAPTPLFIQSTPALNLYSSRSEPLPGNDKQERKTT